MSRRFILHSGDPCGLLLPPLKPPSSGPSRRLSVPPAPPCSPGKKPEEHQGTMKNSWWWLKEGFFCLCLGQGADLKKMIWTIKSLTDAVVIFNNEIWWHLPHTSADLTISLPKPWSNSPKSCYTTCAIFTNMQRLAFSRTNIKPCYFPRPTACASSTEIQPRHAFLYVFYFWRPKHQIIPDFL